MREKRRRGSYKGASGVWGVHLKLTWGELYFAIHSGKYYRSWWLKW